MYVGMALHVVTYPTLVVHSYTHTHTQTCIASSPAFQCLIIIIIILCAEKHWKKNWEGLGTRLHTHTHTLSLSLTHSHTLTHATYQWRSRYAVAVIPTSYTSKGARRSQREDNHLLSSLGRGRREIHRTVTRDIEGVQSFWTAELPTSVSCYQLVAVRFNHW